MIHVRAGSLTKLGAVIAQLGQKEARRAVARALDRTLTSVRKEAVSTIRKEKLVKLPSSEMKSMFKFEKNLRGDIASMSAKVIISGRAIPLSKFYARKVAPPKGPKFVRFSRKSKAFALKAVKVTVMGRVQYAGKGRAFLAGSPKGDAIFMRKTTKRTPLKQLWGPSMADLFMISGAAQRMADYAGERFATTLDAEIRYRLDKIASKKLTS